MMADNKKSFVLYCDLIKTVSKLPNEKAGELFKHLLEYVNDLDPKTDDLLLDIAFEPIKQQLKRDLEKWGKTREGRSKAGKASAETRKLKREQDLTNSTNVKSVQQSSTNLTVNDNVNVNEIKKTSFDAFWIKYPNKIGKKDCLAKWMKLKETDIETILTTIDDFIKHKPFKDYTHPHPKTYLNQERWNDVLESKPEDKPSTDPLVEHVRKLKKQHGYT